MQIPTPIRTPTWVSTRRVLEHQISNLHNCTNLILLKQLHALIYKSNLHTHPSLARKLISAFSLCRLTPLSLNVFNQIHNPDIHLYNTMIRAHTQNFQYSQAFSIFFQMQSCGVFPDNFTYPFLLKACYGDSWLKTVKMVHTHVEIFGFCSDIFVPNSLIDVYSKCGSLGVSYAKKLFSVMVERDVVTWNSMVGGLARAGELEEARKVFDEMPDRNVVTWNSMLGAYAKAGEMNMAIELFERMPERNVISWSTMVSGYSRVGDMKQARLFFDKMPVKNLVAWTIIISGYAEKGLAKEAISLYDQMVERELKIDDGTIISILTACAESGLLGLGKRVHKTIERIKFKCSNQVCNGLVDMYAKCGSLNEALSVFNGMKNRDLVSWNAMIHGLAMHGHGEKALQIFSKLRKEGFRPDEVTFVGVLCACCHVGFIDKGRHYFYTMKRDYGVVPKIVHYGCMIDILGRGGRLKEALRLVYSMPFEPNASIWGALLGACRIHNAVGLAKEVLNRLVKLEPTDAWNFNVLSNIYAAAGEWGSVANVRLQMKNTSSQKPSGASWIELDNEFHEFTAMDTSHHQSERIYQSIDGLRQHLKQIGYVPEACC